MDTTCIPAIVSGLNAALLINFAKQIFTHDLMIETKPQTVNKLKQLQMLVKDRLVYAQTTHRANERLLVIVDYIS